MATSVAAGELVPARNGGRIRRGSKPGNTPGTGRPRDKVRVAAAEALRKGPAVLEEIMGGETTVTIREQCPKCGHEPAVPKTLPVTVRPGERVRAVEALDKLAGEQLTVVFDNARAEAFFLMQDRLGQERFGVSAWEALTADVAQAVKAGGAIR